MAFYTRFVDIDPLRSRGGAGAFNAGAWERAFYDILVQQGGGALIDISGVVGGETVTVDGTTYTEGVDFTGAADAATLAGLINVASGPDLVATAPTADTVLILTATAGRSNAELLVDFGALSETGGTILLFKIDGVTALNPLNQLNTYDGLDGLITTIVNPNGDTIVITEGVDWFVGASIYESVLNWLAEIASATGTPLQLEQAPDPASTVELDAQLAARQYGHWGTNITIAITGPNANQVTINSAAGPHLTPLSPFGGGLSGDAGDQMAAVLNALTPAPASIADVIIRPCNPDFTQWMIVWEA